MSSLIPVTPEGWPYVTEKTPVRLIATWAQQLAAKLANTAPAPGAGTVGDTGWLPIPLTSPWSQSSANPLQGRRVGPHLYITGRLNPTSSAMGAVIATLPEALRPPSVSNREWWIPNVTDSGHRFGFHVQVDESNGQLIIPAGYSWGAPQNAWVPVNVSWLIA